MVHFNIFIILFYFVYIKKNILRALDEEEESDNEGQDNVWGEQKIDDGLVEVAAIYSSFHIAQLQVGLSRSHRIGQARQVKVSLYFYSLIYLQITHSKVIEDNTRLIVIPADKQNTTVIMDKTECKKKIFLNMDAHTPLSLPQKTNKQKDPIS